MISKSYHEGPSLEDENELYLIEPVAYFVLSLTSVTLVESTLYIYMICIAGIGGFYLFL